MKIEFFFNLIKEINLNEVSKNYKEKFKNLKSNNKPMLFITLLIIQYYYNFFFIFVKPFFYF